MADSALPTPFEIALDNAVEGCTRETYGALVATYQARAARDGEVRRLMLGIAADETRHASWSWQLACWLEPQLSAAQRARVVQARVDALRALHEELDDGLSDDDRARLGLPSRRAGAALLQALSLPRHGGRSVIAPTPSRAALCRVHGQFPHHSQRP